MDKLALGKRINSARKEKGLTSEKLAELCDVNATYIRQIETGARSPSLSLFILLCNKLHVSPDTLLADQLDSIPINSSDEITAFFKSLSSSQILLLTSILRPHIQQSEHS